MNTANLQTQLDQIENKIAALSQALITSDTQQLQLAAVALQSAALELANLVKQQPQNSQYGASLQLRLKKIATLLASRRETLIRQSAAVAQALAALVPSSQSNTYAPMAGSYGRQPYGVLARQSGEFKAFSA